MREISDSRLEDWKNAFAKDGIVYETDEEYQEAINNFIGFIEILIEIDEQSKNRTAKENDDNEFYMLDNKGGKILF